MPQATLFEKRKATAEKRAALSAANLCIDCQVREPGKRMDGMQAKRCPFCREKQSIRPHQKAGQPVVREIDDIGNGYLDGDAFIEFCVEVLTAVRGIGRASIGDIKRAMGDAFRDRWIWDGLSALSSVDKVREVSWVAPRRWEAVK